MESSSSSSSPSLTQSQRWLRLLGCVAGIMGCFLIYGLLQEKLMTTEYAPGERFTNSGTARK